ncbi:bifunctional folylpolyglutamate synthase/dihydrofolate synthase [Sulfurospirillum sp. 1307]|jgi:dihydrofolate synthase/folylpolyglutamate synthase
MNLDTFLSAKPLYYANIDYARFPSIFKKYTYLFKLPKIVHIVGTNAKGSTGRALAHLLHVKGVSVGHYSSPHILRFNERIWLNGDDVSDEKLELAHEFLSENIKKEDLDLMSYFEYTTLLAMKIFCDSCDIVVLEAGLGGEFDATNVFEKTLSIITPIDYDHQSFLGNSIKEIATTKLKSASKDIVLAKQNEEIVYELALKQVEKNKSNLYLSNSYLTSKIYEDLENFIKENSYPQFFYDNFSSSLCAFKILGFEPDVKLLEGLKLFGRCQRISKNITIDVGHNPLAAKAIQKNFIDKKVVLIYNSYKDKEYKKVLEILQAIIKEVQILAIDDDRIVSKKELINTLENLNIRYKNFEKIDEKEDYLVFGSFSVVEKFLLGFYEK